MLVLGAELGGAAFQLVQSIQVALRDRKSTRLNSSHTVIYTLSLHDGSSDLTGAIGTIVAGTYACAWSRTWRRRVPIGPIDPGRVERSEEHTSELQSHSDLHSFPTRRLFRSYRCHRDNCRRDLCLCLEPNLAAPRSNWSNRSRSR